MFAQRLDRVRSAMNDRGVEVLLVSVGPELPWLTGYEAMPLERLTMLVVPRDGDATLVVPRLEAARVRERSEVFSVRPYDETTDPVALVAELAGPASAAAIGDRTWARFVIGLQAAMPSTRWSRTAPITGPLRAVKDQVEVEALRAAGAAADRVAGALQAGDIPIIGRTEAEVSAELGRRLISEGHQRVNFAIVAAGANAASPHHEPGETVIAQGDVVLCDFGGTMLDAEGVGYCSDITRCVSLGAPSTEITAAYEVLHRAQAAAVASATVGTTCAAVDATARQVITAAGYGEHFIHRTGHGIGVEEHEDPYIVTGNEDALVAGNAFSIEPGIYVDGAWGLRLEDIVVATATGPDPLNSADHGLIEIEI